MTQGEHIIPHYSFLDDLRKFGTQTWQQPDRHRILVDEKSAVMCEGTFHLLKAYSTTSPSGVYPGKMWKAQNPLDDSWWLCWYTVPEMRGGREVCFTRTRKITIMDWMKLMGVKDHYDPVTKKLVDRVSLF